MDNKENKEVVKEEYSVMELIGMLAQDEEWEKDPEIRKRAVAALIQRLAG